MDFLIIQTNFWDAVAAVPIVMILTQLIKWVFHIPKKFRPTTALLLGLIISVFFSHRHSLTTGLFMGWFYGYSAIGSYASTKTSVLKMIGKWEKKDKFPRVRHFLLKIFLIKEGRTQNLTRLKKADGNHPSAFFVCVDGVS